MLIILLHINQATNSVKYNTGKNHSAKGKCLLQSHHSTFKPRPSTSNVLIIEKYIVGNIICLNLLTANVENVYLLEKHTPEMKKNKGI